MAEILLMLMLNINQSINVFCREKENILLYSPGNKPSQLVNANNRLRMRHVLNADVHN